MFAEDNHTYKPCVACWRTALNGCPCELLNSALWVGSTPTQVILLADYICQRSELFSVRTRLTQAFRLRRQVSIHSTFVDDLLSRNLDNFAISIA